MDTLVVREKFFGVIKRILKEVDLSHAIVGYGIQIIYSVVLDNFEAFSSYYKQSVDHTTNTVSRLIIGNAIRNSLNERWPAEEFQFDPAQITMNEYSGAFNAVFDGSNHVVRIHAYVGVEKGGRYPSQYTVDFYAMKNQVPSVSRSWCCFF